MNLIHPILMTRYPPTFPAVHAGVAELWGSHLCLCGSTGPQALFYSPEERGCITVTNTLLSKQLLFDTYRHPPALQCQFYVFLMVQFKLLVRQNEHEKKPPTYLVLC